MKVLFAASECAPFFKTGGLGDVAGALPKELAKKKEVDDVAVILPYFKDEMKESFKSELKDELWDFVNVGWRREYVGVKSLKKDGVTYYFLDNEHYFSGKGLYGYDNDGERFAFFDLAICQLLERLDFGIPDIIHVNDWQTAMIPFLLKEKFNWITAYQKIKTVLTLHNMQFQGWLDGYALVDLFGMGMERFNEGVVRHDNMLNMLKAGMLYADKVNTVSPSYAQEIKTPAFGCGLDPILNFISDKLSGILNGIDYDLFNPATDKQIEHHFDVKNRSGKQAMKKALQEKTGLSVSTDKPLIGIVSRLTDQKGFDLVLSELEHLLQEDVQIVVLGTGFPNIEAGFNYFSSKYPDRFSANIAFNLKFAQEIYAASDLFLMPSAFEPCGLSQMIAMRYGSLPIVHEIGGLKDTVTPFNPIEKTGNGFGFVQFDGYTLTQTVKQAISLYQNDRKTFDQLVLSAMTEDFSWASKAQHYVTLYETLT